MKVILAGAVLGLAAFLSTANAMPVPVAAGGHASLVEKASNGCGAGRYRNGRGYCVPYGYGAPGYGYPHYGYYDHYRVPREGCPRGMHRGNSGRCVPN